MATLYLPGTRYHWQSRKEYVRDRPLDGGQQPLAFTEAHWELREDPARSLPEVPVVPFVAGDEGEEPRAVFD
jgi:hypothetical protein